MRLPYRFLLGVFSLIIAIFAILFLALAVGWRLPLAYIDAFLAVSANRWGIGIISGFVLLMSLQLLVVSLRTRREREVIVQETGLGRIEITAPALENLIRRAARQIREIREVRPILRYSRDGLHVFLRLGVSPEANIPVVSQDVQQVIRDYLEEKAGIRPYQIQVLIESVSFEARARVG